MLKREASTPFDGSCGCIVWAENHQQGREHLVALRLPIPGGRAQPESNGCYGLDRMRALRDFWTSERHGQLLFAGDLECSLSPLMGERGLRAAKSYRLAIADMMSTAIACAQ